MQELMNDIKKTIVFLGKKDSEGSLKPYATGFLLKIEDNYHLATAKHVVLNPETDDLIDDDMLCIFNSFRGDKTTRAIAHIKEAFQADWIFHEDTQVDIAIIPFGLELNNDDVKFIPNSMFERIERLFELYDVFYMSFQPGIDVTEKVTPVVRRGVVSLINADRSFYIDGAVFPGNSGSPVFLKPSPIRFDQDKISLGGDKLGGKFVGIVGEYVPYREVAVSSQTGRPRVVFEENTGLSRVWSVSLIQEIIESADFKEQVERMRKKA